MRKHLSILVLWLFCLVKTAVFYGQPFERIDVQDGLSQSWVKALEQDRHGFMWMGTSDGLNKYDGYSFTIFKHDPKDNHSLINNDIQALAFDVYNHMWIGTVAGLCYFDEVENKFFTENDYPRNSVSGIVYSNRRMYVGTEGGIWVYELTDEIVLLDVSARINSQLRNVTINSIDTDASGHVWIGTEQGLYIYNPQLDVLSSVDGEAGMLLSNKRVSALEIDHEDRVWIGTAEDGMYMLSFVKDDKIKGSLISFSHIQKDPNSIEEGNIRQIFADKHNNLWIGIENGGLDLMALSNQGVFKHNHYHAGDDRSISNNSIYSIFEDSRGDIWIGTYGDGVNFYNSNGSNFETIRHIHMDKNSLVNNFVNAIQKFEDELWVGTEGGITVVNLETKHYSHHTYQSGLVGGLSNNAIMSIFRDRDKNIWLGTWAGGLNMLAKGSKNFRHFMHDADIPTSIGADNVFAMAQDDKGTLWLAVMNGGLNYLPESDEKFHKFMLGRNSNSGIPSNWVREICLAQNGLLWFATAISVGYYDIENQVFRNFFPSESDSTAIRGNGAYDIYEDSRGTIWFGTDAGLNYYNEKDESFSYYLEENGLPNNSVKSILEDVHGNFWLGTNKGLSKLVNAISLPKKPYFVNYDVNDGLQGNEFNRRAATKDKDGIMYFGGSNGLNYFHPDSIKKNETPPPVVLTNFEIYNRPVTIGAKDSPLKKHISITDAITLKHKHSVFTLEFAALSFAVKEKNQYAYKLEGFDEEWNFVGTQRRATFTNLDAGDYVFKLKAANSDGVWSVYPLELKIEVLPPWWESKIALLGYLVGFLIFLYLFIRISSTRYKEQHNFRLEKEKSDQMELLNQKKLQFFTNISHEFRTPLTLIYSPLEDILKTQHNRLPIDLRTKFQIIYKNSLRLNRLIGELMDFRKMQFDKLTPVVYNQDLIQFLDNIIYLFSEEAKDNKITLSFDKPEAQIKAWFDPGMIEKVLFNLISNALKMTPDDGEITLKVYETNEVPDGFAGSLDKWICVSVKDTGPGLSETEKKQIFDRFYQADKQTKAYYSGTGIGLSLAQGVMDLHHGVITVNSEINKGAEFVIWLQKGKTHFKKEQIKNEDFELQEQVIPREANMQITKGLQTAENIKHTLLIVEDNVELRKYLKAELSRSFKILIARNGKEGLEMTISHFPDVVVSDVIMPVKDGYELCRDIKSNIKISHIPVVLLTARGAVEDQIKGIETGADDYVVKPFNTRLLKAKINLLITSREQLMLKYSGEINSISDDVSFTSLDRNFLKDVNKFVLDNISNPELSVELIGEKLAISRSQLYRKVKALTGISMNEYIRVIRLDTAKKFIESRKYPINEVVYKVGFSSPSYFTKCYKIHFGKLPSEE